MLCGFLRISEALALSWEEITFDEMNMIFMRIRKSKKHPTGKGATVVIACTGKPCHPYQMIKSVQDKKLAKPFPLSQDTAYHYLRDLVVAARLDRAEKINTHSFRKGGQHSAPLTGVQGCAIKSHERWKSSVYTTNTRISLWSLMIRSMLTGTPFVVATIDPIVFQSSETRTLATP